MTPPRKLGGQQNRNPLRRCILLPIALLLNRAKRSGCAHIYSIVRQLLKVKGLERTKYYARCASVHHTYASFSTSSRHCPLFFFKTNHSDSHSSLLCQAPIQPCLLAKHRPNGCSSSIRGHIPVLMSFARRMLGRHAHVIILLSHYVKVPEFCVNTAVA